MIIKLKLRKIGNSLGAIVPKEVLDAIAEEHEVAQLTNGDFILLDVITDWDQTQKYWDSPEGVITNDDGK